TDMILLRSGWHVTSLLIPPQTPPHAPSPRLVVRHSPSENLALRLNTVTIRNYSGRITDRMPPCRLPYGRRGGNGGIRVAAPGSGPAPSGCGSRSAGRTRGRAGSQA